MDPDCRKKTLKLVSVDNLLEHFTAEERRQVFVMLMFHYYGIKHFIVKVKRIVYSL